MTKMRLFTYLAGGALAAAGLLIPGAQAVLLPAGVGLLGLATRWPQDSAPPKTEKPAE